MDARLAGARALELEWAARSYAHSKYCLRDRFEAVFSRFDLLLVHQDIALDRVRRIYRRTPGRKPRPGRVASVPGFFLSFPVRSRTPPLPGGRCLQLLFAATDSVARSGKPN